MKKILIIASLLLLTQNLFAETTTNPAFVAQPHPNQMPSDPKSIPTIKIGAGTSWLRQPRIRFQESELEGQNRKMVVKIYADTSGQITSTKIEQSSGLVALDEKVVRAVKLAKFRPYKENGVAYPFVAEQPFNFVFRQDKVIESNQPEPEFCTLMFNSRNWRAQRLNKETKKEARKETNFEYQTQPQSLTIKTALMGNSEKVIDFSFELSRKNVLSNITLLRSSGVPEIDKKVLASLANAQITAPRKFWQVGNLKFQDQIVFWKSYCR